MAVAEEVKILVRAEVAKAKKNLRSLQTTTKQTQSRIKAFAKSFMAFAGPAAGIALATKAIQKIVKIGKESIQAFKVQEQVEARLNATLKSTGYAAGFTADELTNMASALQEQTTYGDEAVIKAQALLLTFRNIGEETFPRATEAALDLATAMGTDAKSASIQLGKALNDPKVGLTYLNRSGITFTEQQKEMIYAMQEAGDMAGAQTAILEELENQFGGVSKAVGETATGAFDRLKNSIGDYKEIAGEDLANTLHPFVNALTKMIDKVNRGQGALNDLSNAMEKIWKGADAGDLTNELTTQLAVIEKAKQTRKLWGIIAQGNLDRQHEILLKLNEQQTVHEGRIELAKTEAAAIQEQIEWEEALNLILARRESKKALLIEQGAQAAAAEEKIHRSRLSAADQERAKIQDQIDAAWEIVNANEERLSGNEKYHKEEYAAIQKIKELIYELNIEYQNVEDELVTIVGIWDQSKSALEQAAGLEDLASRMSELADMTGKEFDSVLFISDELTRIMEGLVRAGFTFGEDLEGNMGTLGLILELYGHLLIKQEEVAEVTADLNDTLTITKDTILPGIGMAITETNDEIETVKMTAEGALGSIGNLAGSIGNLMSAITAQEIADLHRWAEEADLSANEIADKEKDIQRAAAERNKGFAMFEAALAVPLAILSGLKYGGPAGGVLAGIAAAIQLAAVAATPIPAAATGADFITSGPQMIMVGDNPGGREHVQVTPEGSENINGPSGDAYYIILNDEIIWDSVNKGSANGELRIEKRSMVN